MKSASGGKQNEPTGGEARRRRLRWRFQWRSIGLMALVWLVLSREVSLQTIVGGLLTGWLVTVVFPLPPIRYYGHIHLWGITKMLAALVRDLTVAAVKLTVVALSPRPRIQPGIVRVDLRSHSDLFQVMVASLVSIVPGTLVLEVRRTRRLLYLHVFNLPDAAAVVATRNEALAVEQRVLHAFGSARELAVTREGDGAP